MEYTKGPWKANKMSKLIGYAEWQIHWSPDGECVADIVYKETDANLISAVPDMYEALKALVRLLGSDDPIEVGCHCTDSGDTPIICAWCQAESALAKAEGRTTDEPSSDR